MSTSPPSGAALRRTFLDYFRSLGHTVVPSSSLMPDDPTLFFTNAGMVQFKDVFTGREKRDYRRATTCQKCLRISGKHNDLEEVGHTPRHHTFFEMLGNFSFGDYFKEEAIAWAWKLLTDEIGLDRDRLWVTIHHSDDESFDIWARKVGVPEARIQRLGDKDNFWTMGDVGPCGPCTEIHYDLGPRMSADTRGPEGGDNRYMEIWNNVFMQFEQFPDGSRQPLPRPSVDTGMGLERLAVVTQGVLATYETDLLRTLMEDAAALAGVPLEGPTDRVSALRVLADHARTSAFLVAEGMVPSNEGRAYELRRVVRRAIRYGVKLGLNDVFFPKLTQSVVDRFGDAYPELGQRADLIRDIITREEERFRQTLGTGLRLLEKELDGQPTENLVGGSVVFQLHDTFGFPPDLTRLIANERGYGVDMAGYQVAMDAQRQAARDARGRVAYGNAGAAIGKLVEAGNKTRFVGYDRADLDSEIVALVVGDAAAPVVTAGQDAAIITWETPFYAESGGQSGDTGRITTPGGTFEVTDTRYPVPGIAAHYGRVTSGEIALGEIASLTIDAARRDSNRRAHSATHLLHAALFQVLGDHVAQKGSLVAPDRLRFDFSHFTAMTREQVRRVEDLVYEQVLANTELEVATMGIDEAKRAGARALFGEKYGDVVRVVRIGDFSMELCGGTHVRRTGDIGLFHIGTEGGVAAGVRRLEAETGLGAMGEVRRVEGVIEGSAAELKTSADLLTEAARRAVEENKALRGEIDALRRELAGFAVDRIAAGAAEAHGVKFVAAEAQGSPDMLRDQADRLRDRLGSGVVVLGARDGDAVRLVVAVTGDLAGKRVHAGKLMGELAKRVGGKGGGRPDLAQGGGTLPGELSNALASVAGLLA